MIRLKRSVTLFALLCLAACGDHPAGLSGAERVISDRIREIRQLRTGTAAVWPGFDDPEYDTPLLYFTDSVCYAVNPTPQFRAEFGARIASRTADIEIYKASFPDTLAFHMETHLNMGDSTAYNGRMPFLFCSSPEITAGFIPDVTSDNVWLPMVLHEYAHGFQLRQPGFAAAFAREMTSVSQTELAASYRQCGWLREAIERENALLLAAIAAGTTAERDSSIRSFLSRRRERKHRMAAERGDSTVRMEEIYELMEGMARCVEADAGFRLGSYTEADDWLFRTDRSSYFYATGYNLVRLLDLCGADKSGLYTGRILPLEEFLTTTENRN